MKNKLKTAFNHYRQKVKSFFSTPYGKKLLRISTYLFQAVVIGFIAYQLTGIGWERIWKSLPTEPLFYLLFLFIYFLLPFSETLAYKISWGIPYFKSIPIFIKKRIFNKDVMGYSGEIVLMHWAVNSLPIKKKQAFKDIRDMNIISSAASTFVALGLLLILILTGQIRALDFLINKDFLASTGAADYAIGLILLVIIIAVAYRFRKYLFSMSFEISSKVFLIHSLRMLVLYAAQILQWHIVLPELSLEIWFTFLSVNIVISRIPFLPSQELVATGTNIELAKVLKAPVAAVSGLLLVHDVLGKLLNLFFYLYYSFRERISPGYASTSPNPDIDITNN